MLLRLVIGRLRVDQKGHIHMMLLTRSDPLVVNVPHGGQPSAISGPTGWWMTLYADEDVEPCLASLIVAEVRGRRNMQAEGKRFVGLQGCLLALFGQQQTN